MDGVAAATAELPVTVTVASGRNSSAWPDASWSTRTRAPGATRLPATSSASGCVSMRWMLRFSSRAPYSALVPRSTSSCRRRRRHLEVKEASPSLVWTCRAARRCDGPRSRRAPRHRAADSHHDVDAVDELGREPLAHRRQADVLEASCHVKGGCDGARPLKADIGLHFAQHLARTELLVRKIKVFSNPTWVLSPRRITALSRMPATRSSALARPSRSPRAQSAAGGRRHRPRGRKSGLGARGVRGAHQ